MNMSGGVLNWAQCCLCQTSTAENATDPSKSLKYRNNIEGLKDSLSGYVTNVLKLCHLGECPSNIVLGTYLASRCSSSDENGTDGWGNISVEEFVDEMIQNSAGWHGSCRSKVASDKMERIRSKRKRQTPAQFSPIKTRRSDLTEATSDSYREASAETICFLCDNKKTYNKPLHKAATLQLDAKVRRCASIIGDKKLIAKLSSGELIALDAVYHLPCLTELYRKAGINKDYKSTGTTATAHALAFSELVDYLENQRHTGQVFKMAKLCHMYQRKTC